MKYLIPILLITCAFAQEVTLTFDCPDEVVAGSEGNILPINMVNEENVGGFQIEIVFPSSIVEITSIAQGNIPCCTSSLIVEDTLKVIWFNLLRDEIIPPSDGVIFEIEFDIIENSEYVSFDFFNMIFSSDEGQPMDVDFSDTCTISVVEPPEELEVYLGFGDVDPVENTAEIIMNVNNPTYNDGVAGIQFDITGGHIENTYGGYLQDYFAVASNNESTIVIFGDYVINGTNGILLNVQFNEFDNNEICFDNVILSQSNGLLVESVIIGDCVQITQDCTVPGDVNNDGILNVLDIVGSICFAMDPFYCETQCSADMNGDGSVNVLDIVIMVNMILEG